MNEDSDRLSLFSFKYSYPTVFFLELFLILIMLVTSMIPSNITAIEPWTKLSPLLLIRGFVWILGLSILPGLYILRLTGIKQMLSRVTGIALAVNLSFVFVGLVALIMYHLQESRFLLPWLAIAAISALSFMYWSKYELHSSAPTRKSETSRALTWNIVLVTGIVASILLAFSVQLAQQYLIPGDVWVSLNPAVQITSQRNVFEAFSKWEYPLMFGFILWGLSLCSGLPLANTYVLLFPFVALNILSFYVLVRTVFKQDEKITTIASVIYGFGGGLAWLIETVVFHGETDFWTASFLSQDAYFTMQFWNSIQFSYKSLALTLAYMAIAIFVLSTKNGNRSRKISALSLGSLMILFSFSIHMLEPLVILPVILFAASVYQRTRERYIALGIFSFTTAITALVIDFLMSGYNFWLAKEKLQDLFLTIDPNNILYVLLSFLGILVVIIIVIRKFFSNDLRNISAHASRIRTIRLPIVAGLLGVYLCGLVFWEPASLELASPFPWYSYVTRYGFLGLLALIGIGLANWKDRWFILASSWSIVMLLMGSLWWGSRINCYLFPTIALFAAIGIDGIWRKANTSSSPITMTSNSVATGFRSGFRPIVATLLIVVIGLSFTSVIWGVGYYSSTGPSLSNDEARVLSWIQQNLPDSATVLVPNIYTLSTGVNTIADREIHLSDRLPTTISAASFTIFAETLSSKNIRYAMSVEEEGRTTFAGLLLSYSTIIFQSGKIGVLGIPMVSPPSPEEHNITVLDKESLGFSDEVYRLGWIDDSFEDGWSYSNLVVEGNGETLTLEWEYHTGNESEPIARKLVSPIDTNTYPYILVRYRNTVETSPSSENNVGQIITVVNETGYPRGFVKNFYLPVSNEEGFRVYTDRLPANQSIAEVGIWMRNYEGLNGTIGLQIDYIGFASELIADPRVNTRFLSLALPALWPENYSIASNFDEIGTASILISSYDEDVLNYIMNATYANTFVFLNITAAFPFWGTDWRNVKPGIVTGHLGDRRVIIVGVESVREDLSDWAESIYEELVF